MFKKPHSVVLVVSNIHPLCDFRFPLRSDDKHEILKWWNLQKSERMLIDNMSPDGDFTHLNPPIGFLEFDIFKILILITR